MLGIDIYNRTSVSGLDLARVKAAEAKQISRIRKFKRKVGYMNA